MEINQKIADKINNLIDCVYQVLSNNYELEDDDYSQNPLVDRDDLLIKRDYIDKLKDAYCALDCRQRNHKVNN